MNTMTMTASDTVRVIAVMTTVITITADCDRSCTILVYSGLCRRICRSSGLSRSSAIMCSIYQYFYN